MEVDIEVERTAEALDQGNRAGLGRLAGYIVKNQKNLTEVPAGPYISGPLPPSLARGLAVQAPSPHIHPVFGAG
jgi:hypothetical protein